MTQPEISDSRQLMWLPVSARLDRLAEVERQRERYRVTLELLAAGMISFQHEAAAAKIALKVDR